MLWLLLLPFRLLFGIVFAILALPVAVVLVPLALLLWIPFLLLKFAFRLAAGLIVLPILAVCAVLAILFGAAAMLIPLLLLAPFAFIAWLLMPRSVVRT